jgi:Zn-dependent peptidase ImmA (M78 family)
MNSIDYFKLSEGFVGTILMVLAIMLYWNIKREHKLYIFFIDNENVFYSEIIKWCSIQLSDYSSNPKLKISYDATKKILGEYVFSSNTITIYPNNINSPYQGISTVIHEFNHFLQHQNIENFQLKYSDLNIKYGYELNPYERDSNKLARIKSYKCYDYLKNNL